MNKKDIGDGLNAILHAVKPSENIDVHQSLFSLHNGFEPRDMVVVLTKIKDTFGIDLNDLVKTLRDYSVNCIIDRIAELPSEKKQ